MGEPEINAFLSDLAVRQGVSASTQNQALAAILFLYRHVLEKPLPTVADVVRAKRPRRLPAVLTRAEVRALIARLDGMSRLAALLLYGAGLRLLECLRVVRVKDVEFGSNRIVVRDAKGQRDRVAPLPIVVKAALPAWLARVKRLHDKDLAEGCGDVFVPDALARKYPGSPRYGAGSGSFRPTIGAAIPGAERFVAITSTRASCSAPCGRRSSTSGSRGARAATRCGIRSPPTLSRTAMIFGRSRSSWVTRT